MHAKDLEEVENLRRVLEVAPAFFAKLLDYQMQVNAKPLTTF